MEVKEREVEGMGKEGKIRLKGSKGKRSGRGGKGGLGGIKGR